MRRGGERFKIAVLKMGERTDCGQDPVRSLIFIGTSSRKLFFCFILFIYYWLLSSLR